MEKLKNIKLFLKKRLLVLLGIILVATASYGIYEKFFNLSDTERAQKELSIAVFAVSKHMVLPEGDEPVLATITDAEAIIKQQTFFTGAVNGDQLLLFPKSMKAIIWSPSRKKIINVGPIEQGYATAAAAAVKSEIPNSNIEKMLTVEIRNGTGKMGYASSIAQQLGENAGYKVIKVADAAKKDYAKNIVVNLTNDKSKSSLVNSLASALGASVDSELPDGEKSAEVDALVILGIQDN